MKAPKTITFVIPKDGSEPTGTVTSPTGPFAQEIRSNAMVTGNKNSKMLYNQTSEGIYDEMSKGASLMNNKYLEKIAFVKNLSLTPVDKLKIGLSTTGLGMSATALGINVYDKRGDKGRDATAKKSLTALNNINKALSTNIMVPAPIPVQRPKSIK